MRRTHLPSLRSIAGIINIGDSLVRVALRGHPRKFVSAAAFKSGWPRRPPVQFKNQNNQTSIFTSNLREAEVASAKLACLQTYLRRLKKKTGSAAEPDTDTSSQPFEPS